MTDLEPFWLSLRVALLATLLIVAAGLPVALVLARAQFPGKAFVAGILVLPLVLPPTVLGFYLLIALGPRSPLMSLLAPLGVRSLTFTFTGLVIGSVVYSLPFAVQPIRNAFKAMGERPLEAAATLRAAPLDAFFSVALPLARPGLLTAAILVFAHTVGEFGVVLMIGGGIPGQTKVMSIEIYDLVEALAWGQAHLLAAGLVVFAFAVMLFTLLMERRFGRMRP